MSSSPPGPIFVHPQDATEPIFWLIPAVIAVVGIGVCVVGLVRGRLPERWSAAALVSLPVTAFVLASLVLMERSKATEFCASCHVMTPVLASVYRALARAADDAGDHAAGDEAWGRAEELLSHLDQ